MFSLPHIQNLVHEGNEQVCVEKSGLLAAKSPGYDA